MSSHKSTDKSGWVYAAVHPYHQYTKIGESGFINLDIRMRQLGLYGGPPYRAIQSKWVPDRRASEKKMMRLAKAYGRHVDGIREKELFIINEEQVRAGFDLLVEVPRLNETRDEHKEDTSVSRVGGRGTVSSKWLPFEEARENIRTLKLKSSKEWTAFKQSGQRPPNIPSSPYKTYRDAGWISMPDWLGY
jgi:hypothetical protein